MTALHTALFIIQVIFFIVITIVVSLGIVFLVYIVSTLFVEVYKATKKTWKD